MQAPFANADQYSENYFKTAEEFKKLISDKASRGEIPRSSEKKVMNMINTLSDKKSHLSPNNYSVKNLDILMNMCNYANEFVMTYALFGLQAEIKKGDNPDTAAQKALELMEKNTILFQNELSKLQPFHISCMATQAPVITEFVLALKPEEITGVRLNGLRRFQKGVLGIYLSAFANIFNEQMNSAYHYELVRTLSDSSLYFSKILPVSSRQQIVNYIKSIQAKVLPEFNTEFQKIMDAMKDTTCEGLCAL